MLNNEEMEMLSYDTNSEEEMLTALGLDLMRINNNLYPKLDCMPIDDESNGFLKMVYEQLSSTQAEIMKRLREKGGAFRV